MWEAARATIIPTWEMAMQRMKALNADAWKNMLEVSACHWRK